MPVYGIGITGIDISETYRNGFGIGHAPGESQAIDGNFGPMGRDEFLPSKGKLLFASGIQANGSDAQSNSGEGKNASEYRKPQSIARESFVGFFLGVLIGDAAFGIGAAFMLRRGN